MFYMHAKSNVLYVCDIFSTERGNCALSLVAISPMFTRAKGSMVQVIFDGSISCEKLVVILG